MFNNEVKILPVCDDIINRGINISREFSNGGDQKIIYTFIRYAICTS